MDEFFAQNFEKMNESFGGNLDNVIRNLEEKINSIKTTYKIWDTLLIVCMFKANLFINTRANNSIITSFFPTPYSDLHLWRILSPWWHHSMRHIWVPIFCWPPWDALRWPSPPRWNMPDENWRLNRAHTHSQSICPVNTIRYRGGNNIGPQSMIYLYKVMNDVKHN